MALEPQIKEIEINSSKKLECVVVPVSVTLNTNGEKIEKVLLMKSYVKIEKTTVIQGGVQVEGALNSFALIKLESGEFVEIKKTTNFSQNFSNSQIDVNAKVLAKVQVASTEGLSVNEISLNFVAQVNLSIYICEKQMVKYVEELNKANQKMGTISYQTIQNLSTENFEILSEIELPSSISKILSCDCEINLKDAICAKDIVTLGGEICTNLIYLTSDDVPKIKQQNNVSEFHQEIMIGGVGENDNITMAVFVF